MDEERFSDFMEWLEENPEFRGLIESSPTFTGWRKEFEAYQLAVEAAGSPEALSVQLLSGLRPRVLEAPQSLIDQLVAMNRYCQENRTNNPPGSIN